VPKLSSFSGRQVLGAGGRTLGRVSAVLFHATEPRIVGVEVDPGAVLGLIDRRPAYVLLGDLGFTDDRMAFTLDGDKLPKDSAGAKALGFSWDESVVWRCMPVRSAEGDEVGTVHDVDFELETGEVTQLWISTGAVGDVAIGRLEVPRELIRGFDGEAVIVLPGYAEIPTEGGAAKVVASGAAAVKARGGQVAEGALEVGVAASRARGRSIKGGVIRKAIDKTKSLMDEDG
jgi:sporulation protein YlmC with PRC-barrel domain